MTRRAPLPLLGMLLLALALGGCGDSGGGDGTGDDTSTTGDDGGGDTDGGSTGADTSAGNPGDHLCDPCEASDACGGDGGACVKFGPEGSFCGTSCATGTDCGDGFSCLGVITAEGTQGQFCVPQPEVGSGALYGTCTCSAAAIAAELSTACSVGPCPGVRTCEDGGLGACDAPLPILEICDGKDNDCDGTTDEESCDDGQPCTTDVCEAESGCQHTSLADGTSCDDGSACTLDESCTDGTCLPGETVSCSDGNACTDDSCNTATGGCLHDPLGADTACDDGDVCTEDDYCTAGSCTSGAPADCDDLESCTIDTCDPVTGACVHEAAPDEASCDDGLVCSVDDTCSGGVCSSSTLNPCDDGEPCTADSCDETLGGCQHGPTNEGLGCDDGDPCTEATTCQSGLCTGATVDGCVYATPPDIAACEQGVIGETQRALALEAVNAVRGLVGVAPLAYDEPGEAGLQAAALTFAAQAVIVDVPMDSWPCWTDAAALASPSATAILLPEEVAPAAPYDPAAVVGAIVAGLDDPDLLGRRRLIDPFLLQTSYAVVDGAPTALGAPPWVQVSAFDFLEDVPDAIPEPVPSFVAVPNGQWPLAFFDTGALLSFGAVATPTDYWINQFVDFSSVVITVTGPGDAPMEITDVASTTTLYGLPNHLQWRVVGLEPGVEYTVTLAQVFVIEEVVTFSYPFTLTP